MFVFMTEKLQIEGCKRDSVWLFRSGTISFMFTVYMFESTHKAIIIMK